MPLAERDCVPCRAGTSPLPPGRVAELLREVPGWGLNAQGHLERGYRFPDFASALAFVDRVGALAGEQDHHPDIRLAWGLASVEIWTHAIGGLSESDFVFAAKTDRLRGAP